MRPLLVRITSEKKPLSAGSPYELTCEVAGARPEPVITWWLGSVQLKDTRETVSVRFNKAIGSYFIFHLSGKATGHVKLQIERTGNVISLPVNGEELTLTDCRSARLMGCAGFFCLF